MDSNDFVKWIRGFNEIAGAEQTPTTEQWNRIIAKLEEVHEVEQITEYRDLSSPLTNPCSPSPTVPYMPYPGLERGPDIYPCITYDKGVSEDMSFTVNGEDYLSKLNGDGACAG